MLQFSQWQEICQVNGMSGNTQTKVSLDRFSASWSGKKHSHLGQNAPQYSKNCSMAKSSQEYYNFDRTSQFGVSEPLVSELR